MTRATLMVCMIGLMGTVALGQASSNSPKPTDPKGGPTNIVDREKMASMHEKMASCLRGTKSINECHDEMHASCQQAMGPGGCPMMGGPRMMDRPHRRMMQPGNPQPSPGN